MSTSSGSSSHEKSFDVEELIQIGTRCRELRKEKEMLRESQSHSFNLIRRLGIHVKSLSEARLEDKKQIQKLEKELLNCYQEIDYLQDQLNVKNEQVDSLSEHAHSLEMKLGEIEHLEDEKDHLREELTRSKSECLLLMQELDSKEAELQISTLSIEKLEESISSLTLESQCEIESMKLDLITLEQAFSEAKKVREESVKEKARMSTKLEELQVQFQESQDKIRYLEKENKELREKYATPEMNVKAFCLKIQKQLENNDKTGLGAESFATNLRSELPISQELGELLDAILSKLVPSSDAEFDKKMENMAKQINEYEQLVKQLKEELIEEKLKAKEEAEDLAQEMAELRYKMTCLLEEEYKRRARVEQVSLQRIAELEAQIKRERSKSFTSIFPVHDV